MEELSKEEIEKIVALIKKAKVDRFAEDEITKAIYQKIVEYNYRGGFKSKMSALDY